MKAISSVPNWLENWMLWAIAMTGLVLLSLCAWLLLANQRLRRQLVAQMADANRDAPAMNEVATWKQVQQALAQKNPTALRMAVQRWARTVWPAQMTNGHSQAGLRAVASHIDNPELTRLIDQFDAALFDDHGEPDKQPMQLAAQIVTHLASWRKSASQSQGRNARRVTRPVHELPALYPGASST